jgi:hypothetical protein
MVIPRKQWIEWWSMNTYHEYTSSPSKSDKVYPFLRRQCGLTCDGIARTSHNIENG